MIDSFLKEVKDTIDRLDRDSIKRVIDLIANLKGRLFIVGSGGGAGNASHAVCDFRKLCDIDALTFENISELTARVNDDGWGTTLTAWLAVSDFDKDDCLFVLSVGGGTETVSVNLHSAILYAKNVDAKIIGIVGREESTLVKNADAYILVKSALMTPVVEGLQSVLLHLICTKLAKNKTVW
jgi:D-sedoheptulose 7-phosphate isomerase